MHRKFNEVSTLQIDVRWRPEGTAVSCHYDKSFQGEMTAAIIEATDHIERNFLTLTTIKAPDCAESKRFWNFDLSEIKTALRHMVTDLCPGSSVSFWVDIGYQALTINAGPERPIVRVLAHPLARPPQRESR
jgi:hypothetical protein